MALSTAACAGANPAATGPPRGSLPALIAATPVGGSVPLRATRYVLTDFRPNLLGANLGQRGLVGAGVGRTLVEMAPHSSTKAARIPTEPYTTNQLYLLSTIGGAPQLSGFTLLGTPQGHLYNGLRVARTVGARVHDVWIEHIPGGRSFPPGETFALNDYRTDHSVYTHLTIDGSGVSAAGFATNSSWNVTVNDSTFTRTAYSAGATIWQTRNVTMNRVRVVGNRSGINFERSGGTIRMNRPTFRHNGSFDLQFGTDLAGGTVTITDPVLAAGQRLRLHVPARYHGRPNGQLRSRIHVLVHGVDRTRQLVQYL